MVRIHHVNVDVALWPHTSLRLSRFFSLVRGLRRMAWLAPLPEYHAVVVPKIFTAHLTYIAVLVIIE
jgi:hypothetical protein